MVINVLIKRRSFVNYEEYLSVCIKALVVKESQIGA